MANFVGILKIRYKFVNIWNFILSFSRMKGMFTFQEDTKLHFISFGHWETRNRLTLFQIRFVPQMFIANMKKTWITYKRLWPIVKSTGTQSYVAANTSVSARVSDFKLYWYLTKSMWDFYFGAFHCGWFL